MAKIGAFHWSISSSINPLIFEEWGFRFDTIQAKCITVIFCKLMDPTDRPKLKNALNEKWKKLRGFSFSINIANFEAFCWTKKLISNLLFLKSDQPTTKETLKSSFENYSRHVLLQIFREERVIFYTEILIGKVVLWCFFTSETSEKIHNSTFQVKISV